MRYTIRSQGPDADVRSLVYGARYTAGVREIYIIGPWPELTSIAPSVLSDDELFWDADVMTRENTDYFRIRVKNGEALYKIEKTPHGRLLHLVQSTREPQEFWPEGKS